MEMLSIKFLSGFLTVISLFGFMIPVFANDSTETSKVETVLRDYEKALAESDVNSVMNLYTEDGVFMPQHSTTQVGAKKVRSSYENVFKNINLDIDFNILEIRILSDQWAFVRTTSSGTITINATGQKVAENNQELFLLRKEPTGEWKIARYIFSTTNPRSKN